MLSTVAGSVLTFVLGLGDRHNDNIMMRTNGQSFHIDFSKVFGNFQKILNFNRCVCEVEGFPHCFISLFFVFNSRDRSPFILTPDMLEVVKMAMPPSSPPRGKENVPKELANIPVFVEHCCTAYNLLRKYAFSFMGILEMASVVPV